jgi:hypothetical protein
MEGCGSRSISVPDIGRNEMKPILAKIAVVALCAAILTTLLVQPPTLPGQALHGRLVIYPQPVQSGQVFTAGSYPVGLVPIQMASSNGQNGQNNNNLAALAALGIIQNAAIANQNALLVGGIGGKIGVVAGGLNGGYGCY